MQESMICVALAGNEVGRAIVIPHPIDVMHWMLHPQDLSRGSFND